MDARAFGTHRLSDMLVARQGEQLGNAERAAQPIAVFGDAQDLHDVMVVGEQRPDCLVRCLVAPRPRHTGDEAVAGIFAMALRLGLAFARWHRNRVNRNGPLL